MVCSPLSRLPLALFSLLIICVACATPSESLSAGSVATPTTEVFSSPNGGAIEAVIREIVNAKQEILVQAYSFSSASIARALVDAHKRGRKTTVVLDKSQRSERYSSATLFAKAGIPTFIDAKHAIAHNRFMRKVRTSEFPSELRDFRYSYFVIDQKTVITGSFDFTKAAGEKNAGKLLVIKGDANLVRKYLADFKEHLEHSEKYDGR